MKKNETKPEPPEVFGTVQAKPFRDVIKKVTKHADVAPSIPILNCVVLEFDGLGYLRVAHHGLDMEIKGRVEAEGSGAVVVPAKRLAAFVGAADGDTVEISKAPGESAVSFKCGRFTLKLIPLPIADVPQLRKPVAYDRVFSAGEGVLSRMLTLVDPFISTEETRYYLNGVCFELEENKVRVIATDGHKLGTTVVDSPDYLEKWDAKCIVPRFACLAATRIIGAGECLVKLHSLFIPERHDDPTPENPNGRTVKEMWEPKTVEFSTPDLNWTITAKLIDGTYPVWRRVVPSPMEFVTATPYTGDIIKMASIAKSIGSRAVRISYLGHDRILVGTTSPDDDGSGSAEVRASVVAEFQPFGVNGDYLASIAKAFGTPMMEMRITGSGDPILLFPQGGGDGDTFAVLMPMRI